MKKRSRAGGKTAKPRSQGLQRGPLRELNRRGSTATIQKTELAGLARDLDQAREQLTAASDVLRAISSLRGDLEPIFQSTAEECDAPNVAARVQALSGLARAFFYAGAKSLVVSHWEVDSEATVALMSGLFAALKAHPDLSHAEALRMSMLQMIGNSSKPEWAEPSVWAPFVIVGEPNRKISPVPYLRTIRH